MAAIHKFWFGAPQAAMVALVIGVSGCASGGMTSSARETVVNPHTGRPVVITDRDGPNVLRYQYRQPLGFVRVERSEDAIANDHPFTITEPALRALLANIKVTGGLLSDEALVFSNEELDELVPPLAAALAQAGAQEDLCFAVTGKHGVFGAFSSRAVTTGRVFVRDGRLNLVFGLVHEPYESQLSRTDVLRPFTPGSRTARLDTTVAMTPGERYRIAPNRPDWITFEAAAVNAPTAAPTTEAQPRDLEGKLRLLKRLHEQGLITDEEYRNKRQSVLQGL